MATKRPARLVDVAREAGVGTSVVSRVLNGDTTLSIRSETRERIVAAAKRLDYRPNGFARGLKIAKTMTLGLVINLGYSENAELIAAVEHAAIERGYLTLLADAAEFIGEGETYRRLLLERRVDGLLVATSLGDDAFLHELSQYGIPVLAVNRRLRRGGPSTSLDDERGMRVAVDHLIRLGHTRIAYIEGPLADDISRRRLQGFQAAIRAGGIRSSSKLIVQSSGQEAGGFAAMEHLLSHENRPSAVAVWSVTTAVGALAAARQAGLSIPADMSIIAFHDAPIAEYLEPPLATVRMPVAKMAVAAVRSIIEMIEGSSAVDAIVERPAPALVRRGSTAPPSRSSKL